MKVPIRTGVCGRSELLMLRHDPAEWARLCREQAELTPDIKISGLLMQLAEQCDALAERIGADDLLPNEPADRLPD